MGGLGKTVEEMAHTLVQHAVVGQLLAELAELLAIGKLAKDQKICSLDKCRFLGEFLDGITAIAQNTVFAVEIRDATRRGARVAKPRVEGDVARFTAQLANIDRPLVLCSNHDVEIVLFSVKDQFCGIGHAF